MRDGDDGNGASVLLMLVFLFPGVSLDPQGSSTRRQARITWRGSDAQAACEVIFESSENGRHVRFHLVQVDDIPHQSRADVDLGRLALGLG